MKTLRPLLQAPILIVGDSPDAAVLGALLKAEGYTGVTTASPGQDTAQHLARQHCDLAVLEFHPPLGAALLTLRRLQTDMGNRQVPVLALTAREDRPVQRAALQAGATDVIGRPFEPLETSARVRNALELGLLRRRAALWARHASAEEEHDADRVEPMDLLERVAVTWDAETGLHEVRTGKYCAILAGAAGMDAATCDLFIHASLAHDIGKIGIPPHILHKNGKLDPEERTVMKTHTTIGAQILADTTSPLMSMAREIALMHHERWDGAGYPGGLRGDEIALPARVVAVCDVFDALTAARPYKRAWSAPDALSYLQQNAGQHFDPTLVAHFGAALPEIVACQRAFDTAGTPTC